MASSDALRVVEDWISEHYFTSDAANETFHKRVVDRRKEWDAAEEPTSWSRLTAARGELLAAMSALYPDATSGETLTNGDAAGPQHQPTLVDDDLRDAAANLYTALRTVLGYQTGEFHQEGDAPVRRYGARRLAEMPLAIVEAAPVQTLEDLFIKKAPTLLEPWTPLEEGEPLVSVSQALSELFAPRGDAPAASFALVMAGRWLVVTEGSRFQQGRYLGVDLQTVLERSETKRGGELDTALTCIDAQSLAPDPDGAIWWSDTLEDSSRHTAGVSEDLREGVRTSIEIIANEVVSPPSRPGPSAACRRPGPAAGPAGPAVPVPDPLPALRRGLPAAGHPAGRRSRVRRRLLGGPAARPAPGAAHQPAGPPGHPHLPVPRGAVPAHRPGTQ
ncbi:hypothetical protein [Acidipropionibacterium jensenii]|uniref:hypothetical protein n=1 Tax=Acidipropionibacterium jensenii TaxID=1749 RepID=UPI000BC34C2D|nr:hypothetical protein [Acidipropionibacterium jensenii]